MTEKKRTTYKRGSKLDLPQGLDKAKFGYRWIDKSRFEDNSDGYEERGYSPHKDSEGKVIKRGDMILGRMPIDEYEGRKADIEEARVTQTEFVLQKQAAEDDKLAHEFKKKGGKTKFTYTQE